MPLDELHPNLEAEGYLAFLGRMSPEKRADRAIEVARRAGALRIAAKVDDADRRYFEREIEPLLEQDHVDFIGEIGPDEKASSSATHGRSSSRSTGTSRSGWR